ncbi:MAG: PAN domain-containing protein [Rhizobiales bacterium]|nr:PAN domain-containing protein [Hyphomicrobiales bacterium]
MRLIRQHIFVLGLCLVAFGTGLVHAQIGFDRLGGDYSNFPVRSGDPAVCAARCDRDSRCRAWSFSYPTTALVNAVCWLKNQVTPPILNNCCISGVRGGALVEPRSGPVEYSIDRIGGDYRHFDILPDARGQLCATACQADNRCRAWTYLRPGYGTATARCYLKDNIKPPRRQPCCISGVVR